MKLNKKTKIPMLIKYVVSNTFFIIINLLKPPFF